MHSHIYRILLCGSPAESYQLAPSRQFRVTIEFDGWAGRRVLYAEGTERRDFRWQQHNDGKERS